MLCLCKVRVALPREALINFIVLLKSRIAEAYCILARSTPRSDLTSGVLLIGVSLESRMCTPSPSEHDLKHHLWSFGFTCRPNVFL